MQNLITIALLCLCTNVFSQEPASGNSINANLAFGRYSDCFRPGGICTFEPNQKDKVTNTQVTLNENNTITLNIDRNQISPNTVYYILGEKLTEKTDVNHLHFKMEEELKLDEAILSNLKYHGFLNTISVGTYPIKVTKEYLIITLKLK